MSIVIDSLNIVKYAAMSYPGEEMDQIVESEKAPLQIGREAYLAGLSEVDQVNIKRVVELFDKSIKGMGREGSLLAVGGTITKPAPRPDIDLVVALQKNPGDPNRKDFDNNYDFAVEEFKILKNFVVKMIGNDPWFKISHTYEPVLAEPDNLNYIKHEGKIRITDQEGKGTPIEFLKRLYQGSFAEFQKTERRPYVMLSSVEKQQFIPLPNLRNPEDFQHWLETYIKTPIKGFEDLKHPDGTPYTKEEQLEATRKQIADVVNFKHSKREPLEDIIKMLMNYAYESGNTSRTQLF